MYLLVRSAACAALASLVFTSSAWAAITFTDHYTIPTPAGYTEVRPEGSTPRAGTKTIGYAYGTATGQQSHAVLWNGSSTLIDLNPAHAPGRAGLIRLTRVPPCDSYSSWLRLRSMAVDIESE